MKLNKVLRENIYIICMLDNPKEEHLVCIKSAYKTLFFIERKGNKVYALQRTYTGHCYIDFMEYKLKEWDLDTINYFKQTEVILDWIEFNTSIF